MPYDRFMPHVISIANNKGGVGKTTTALHLAAGLAQHGHAVLLVDADASNSSSLCWSRAKEGGEAPFQVIGMSQPVIHKTPHATHSFFVQLRDHRLSGGRDQPADNTVPR